MRIAPLIACLFLCCGLLAGTTQPVHAQAVDEAGDDSGWLEQGELLSPEDEQTLLEIAGGNETHAGVDEVIERHRYESTLQSEELTGLLESTLRTGDGDESAGLLREILSRPEFQDGSAPTQQNNGAIDRFVQWLNRTLSGLGRSLGLGAAGGSLLTYVLVVLALALMAMLIRQLIMGAGRPAAKRGRDGLDPEADPDADLARIAEEHARRGEYRLAMRYRFLAVLRSLDLPSSTLTTNSSLVRQVRRDFPMLHEDFRELVGMFEDVWYGALECGSGQYAEAAGLAGSLDQRIRVREEQANG
ncbi:DUF4129 domain-containing protein [bacterium]|nr:DUF4129 domain-containing protein [bacterium]